MAAGGEPVVFGSGAPGPGAWDVEWIHGSPPTAPDTGPALQVHAVDEHTFVLRQSMAVDHEAPFVFLLFGNERAVLIDTGATASAGLFPLREVVDGIVERWLAARPRDGYRLIVLHTHAHRDHVAADGQFAGRPDTVVVPADRAGARAFLGLTRDLDSARMDLGGRVLECLATPGHHDSAVTFHDPHTGFLLTGDTVYPGRLYVEDPAAFRRSIDRLIEFAGTAAVSHVVGCHIEMTREPGVDFPILATYQPGEPPLQMTVDQLRDIRAALEEIGDRPGRHVFDDFVICCPQG
jgi:glyoxylase-like metal-dependent hydrolase (beta-lactamase superfamily II)